MKYDFQSLFIIFANIIVHIDTFGQSRRFECTIYLLYGWSIEQYNIVDDLKFFA